MEKLLAECEILKKDGMMTFSKEPNQPKQTQKESEHVVRFFVLDCCKVNAYWAI
jgi:hypothetical protein